MANSSARVTTKLTATTRTSSSAVSSGAAAKAASTTKASAAVKNPSSATKPSAAAKASKATSVRATGTATVGKVSAAGTKKPPVVAVDPKIEAKRPPLFPALPFTVRALRPDDFVVLEFTFVNLRVESRSGGHGLRRRNGSEPAYIVLGFPPQHILEQAFFEVANEVPIPPPPPGRVADPDQGNSNPETPTDAVIPVGSRISGPSRLVFRVPAREDAIPYTLAGLLEFVRTCELAVAPVATPPDPELIYFPGLEYSAPHAGLSSSAAIKAAMLTSPSMADPAAATPTTVTRSRSSTRAKVVSGPAAAVSVSASASASAALAATVFAESRNQWYAARSPLARATAELKSVADILGEATARVTPQLREPSDLQTALELPTRVTLSPHVHSAWAHATAPVLSATTGRVELWHTRLGVRSVRGSAVTVSEAASYLRTVRAIWSPDARLDDPLNPPPHANTPFRASLDGFDRHNVVHLSANHTLVRSVGGKRVPIRPKPLDVERLMLSSLGGWLDSRGAWDPPNGLSVEEWRHRATLGRDHYVRVVYKGALYPWGHRASLIKVTERKFHPNVKGNAAILRQRMFIVVREPYRLIGNTGLKRADGTQLDLQMPFKGARLTTLVTPNLDDPANSDLRVNNVDQLQSLFWPHVGAAPFQFHVQLEDEGGALSDITMPLLFVGHELTTGDTGFKAGVPEAILSNYNAVSDAAMTRRRPEFRGQRVQLAPTSKPGDTHFEMGRIEFQLEHLGGRLVPFLARAQAAVPALQHLARGQTQPEVTYPKRFLTEGFVGDNPAELFLETVTSTAMSFSSQSNRSGGFAAPDFAISGLSRSLGPVGGDLNTLSNDPKGFKPDQVLDSLSAKLFGCIKLADVLQAVGLGDLSKLPRFLNENFTAAQALLDDLQRIQTGITAVQGALGGLAASFNAVVSAANGVTSSLSALLGAPLDGAKREAFKTAFQAFASAAQTLLNGLTAAAAPTGGAGFAKQQLEQTLNRLVGALNAGDAALAMADRIADALEAITEQRLRFEWRPDMKNWPEKPKATDSIFQVTDDSGNPKGGFVVAVQLGAQSNSQLEPTFDVSARLENFVLNLIAPETFLRLRFNKVEFVASSRKKPDVNVDFGGIEFVGVLSFVESLRSLIPLDGFSDPPYLDVSEQGIKAGFSLALPNLAVGVFSLSNLSLGAAFTVPFIGESLSVRFNFCERNDPFNLTVSLFGGGGFFAVTVTPAGVQILEAAFEFGACCALDFGVASGSIKVVAGIYYRMEADDASLTGYFNLKGRVSVLGLISASLELALEITYEFSSGKCKGRASLIIEVEVLFFSASVEVVCEKKFAGSNGDPAFADVMVPYADLLTGETVDPWADYCESFAA